MKTILVSACCIALTTVLPAISIAESLCSPEEKPLFACKLEKSTKSVSLCQSKSDARKIYYKFSHA